MENRSYGGVDVAEPWRAIVTIRHQTPPIREIRVAILQLLANGYPKLSIVADQIGIKQRTLQRRLTAAGTSYTELVNELRFELAKKLLQDNDTRISTIASELGFGNHSGFCRAFHSWSHMTPREYRARHRRPAAAAAPHPAPHAVPGTTAGEHADHVRGPAMKLPTS